jgi:hypothetical protein
LTILNIFVFVLGGAFIVEAFSLTPTTAMQQIYTGVLFGSGGIILAVAALILAIERRNP